MWAIRRRHSRFWTPVSTSRTTVKIPSRNTTGSTVATSGTNARLDPTENPMATSELDNAMTYNDALVPLSLTVVLAVDWSAKCSVVSAAMNACSRACWSITIPVPSSRPPGCWAPRSLWDARPRPDKSQSVAAGPDELSRRPCRRRTAGGEQLDGMAVLSSGVEQRRHVCQLVRVGDGVQAADQPVASLEGDHGDQATVPQGKDARLAVDRHRDQGDLEVPDEPQEDRGDLPSADNRPAGRRHDAAAVGPADHLGIQHVHQRVQVAVRGRLDEPIGDAAQRGLVDLKARRAGLLLDVVTGAAGQLPAGLR